jgi:hypothetical protein
MSTDSPVPNEGAPAFPKTAPSTHDRKHFAVEEVREVRMLAHRILMAHGAGETSAFEVEQFAHRYRSAFLEMIDASRGSTAPEEEEVIYESRPPFPHTSSFKVFRNGWLGFTRSTQNRRDLRLHVAAWLLRDAADEKAANSLTALFAADYQLDTRFRLTRTEIRAFVEKHDSNLLSSTQQ